LPLEAETADDRAEMVLRVHGVTLPDEIERDLFVDGAVLRIEPSSRADSVVKGGWLLPGLVDMHTHPGAERPGDPFDDALFRRHVGAHRDAGVLALRCPGLARRLPDRLREADGPRLFTAGRWLAAPGGFFDGWGREVPLERLPDAAVEEAVEADGWCKVIADWMGLDDGERTYRPTVPAEIVAEIVRRVHEIGGRVAVHTQHEDGAEAAVAAGADSIEHGMHLPARLLDRMAENGTALVPTLHAFSDIPEHVAANPKPDAVSRFLLRGWETHPALVRAAWEAGVTVLAGTDDLPHGNVVAEIVQLARAGLPPDGALGAACWTARAFLGLPGFDDGARADVVVFDADPRTDLEVLRHPSRILVAGRVVV
jgi:imidazolonepropionase-like amidohydrolase